MKIPLTHSYREALTVIALLRVLNSKTVTLLFRDHTLRAHFIRKALSQKHIRKATVQERINEERKSVTLFSITRKGLNYIARKDSGLYELLLHRPDVAIFNSLEAKAPARIKLAAIANTVVLVYSAGANISKDTFGSIQSNVGEGDEKVDDDKNESEIFEVGKQVSAYTLREFYRDYLDEQSFLVADVFESEHSVQDDDYLVFYERGTVKSLLAQESERGDIKDFQSGRYTGILESHFKTVMMYAAPLYTMPWSRWLVNAELNAYRMWGRTYSITDVRRQNKNLTMAAVIVNNARDFAYHFLSAKRKREKGEVFGGAFAHVYVIPNDPTGIRFLNWLMLVEDDAIQRDMIDMAIRSGEFSENKMRSAIPFVLRSRSGIETAVLLTMDAKQMISVRYYAEEKREAEFWVICFDWQVDYLKRILPPNVSYRPISFSIIQESER